MEDMNTTKNRLFRGALLIWVVFCVISSASAQKARYESLQDALLSSRRLSGKRGPSNVTWINGGERYSFTRSSNGTQEIWVCNPETGGEDRVFTADGLVFPDTENPFRYRSFQWTQDGRYLLFQTRFQPVWRYSGNADYFYYSLEDKSLKLVAEQAYTAEVSPNGKMVAYEKEGDLYVYSFEEDQVRRLTDDASESFFNGRFGWAYEEEFGLVQGWYWSPDSRYIAFWQSDEREVPVYQLTDFSGKHPEYMKVPYPKVGDPVPKVRIGVIDVGTGEKVWLDTRHGEGYVPRIYWTARPGVLAVQTMNRAQNELKLILFDVTTGEGRQVMYENSDSWIDVFDFFSGTLHLMYFPEEHEEFFWISDRDGWSHIYRYDYEGKLLGQVTEGPWEVIRIEAMDEEKEIIYYTSTEDSPLERHLYSVKFNGKRKKKLTDVTGNHRVNMSPHGKYYIDSYSNVSTPTQVEVWTTAGKKLRVLEDNRQVLEFKEEHVAATRELFSFTTSDGQKLDGFIMKPVDFDPEKSYPLLLSVYGGPGAQSVYNSWSGGGWEQWLAQEGYVIAGVNNRGSGGYGDAFEKVVYRNLGHWESHDFVETARYLASFPWVDGDRMAIRGHSYGGYSSAYTILTHPGVFKVALVGAPVTDQRLYDCIYTERYMGLLEDNEEGYVNSAVVTHAAGLEGKMLIAHSLMDENVHPQNTFQLVKALIDNGKDHDLKIYPPGAHGVAYNTASSLLLYNQYTDYLDRYLKEKE